MKKGMLLSTLQNKGIQGNMMIIHQQIDNPDEMRNSQKKQINKTDEKKQNT